MILFHSAAGLAGGFSILDEMILSIRSFDKARPFPD